MGNRCIAHRLGYVCAKNGSVIKTARRKTREGSSWPTAKYHNLRICFHWTCISGVLGSQIISYLGRDEHCTLVFGCFHRCIPQPRVQEEGYHIICFALDVPHRKLFYTGSTTTSQTTQLVGALGKESEVKINILTVLAWWLYQHENLNKTVTSNDTLGSLELSSDSILSLFIKRDLNLKLPNNN